MNGRAGISKWGTRTTRRVAKVEFTISRELFNQIQDKRNEAENPASLPEISRMLLRDWVNKR